MGGKIALVTGAGTGIGRATATALVRAGWETIFVGRRIEKLEEAVAVAEGPGRAIPIACDVTNPEQVEVVFARVEREFGRLDLLFNNAGMGARGAPIDEIPVEVWRQIVDINLTGSFLCARAAFGLMRRQKPMGGRIINNGSISAHAPRPYSAPYTATKHAVTGLT
jgi:NAD(P)-dependent dehydrogenase (short-subunit alcohol dehydrogenase family)